MWNYCMLSVSRCLSCHSLVIALFLLHWLNSPTIIVLSEIKSTVERWSLFQNTSLLKWSYVYIKNTHHFEFTLVTATICSKLTYHPFWKENHFVEAINRSEQRRLLVIKLFNVMERIIIFNFPNKWMTEHLKGSLRQWIVSPLSKKHLISISM